MRYGCQANMQRFRDILRDMRLRFTGHILCTSDDRHVKRALKGLHWMTSKNERPQVAWGSTLKKDYSLIKLD